MVDLLFLPDTDIPRSSKKQKLMATVEAKPNYIGMIYYRINLPQLATGYIVRLKSKYFKLFFLIYIPVVVCNRF